MHQYLLICGIRTGGSDTSYNYLAGDIYSARIYNKPLTDDEVLANYNATIAYQQALWQN